MNVVDFDDYWSEDELATLMDNVHSHYFEIFEVFKNLGFKRTPIAISTMKCYALKEMGEKHPRFWTDDELKLLKANIHDDYYVIYLRFMERDFKRSPWAIYSKKKEVLSLF